MDATKTIIGNLKSYVTYEISIKAFNQIGEGPASPSLTVTTLESGEFSSLLFFVRRLFTKLTKHRVRSPVPSSAPQNVECLALSPEAIRIKWRPPPQQFWNGVLQGYKLYYQLSNPKPGKEDIRFIYGRYALNLRLVQKKLRLQEPKRLWSTRKRRIWR